MGPVLAQFVEQFSTTNVLEQLRAGLIGKTATFEGPYGRRRLIYADYVASGRALQQVEQFMLEAVLPYYANSHTETSYCGQFMTALRNDARAAIGRSIGAGAEHAVIFSGSGATAGLNRLVSLLGVSRAVRDEDRVVIYHGPYEHHSNLLPWRESGAVVIAIPEAEAGGPDLVALESALAANQGALQIGTFSAASNVSGIISDVVSTTRLLKRHGALAVWDYAAGGPYLEMDMTPAPDAPIDAIVVSPHKFVGGPGASGLLVIRRDAVTTSRPTWPGGGTVSFVSRGRHDYLEDVVAREEAGTPNILGDVRAALAFLVKNAVGTTLIAARHAHLGARAMKTWARNPRISVLGSSSAPRLPIFSLRFTDSTGNPVHHQHMARALSDIYGIQARGGCSCAGPYGLSLLGIDEIEAEHLRERILAGHHEDKPGWVRLNLSYLMDDKEADTIIAAVDELASADDIGDLALRLSA